ncbi:MAG: ATP-binding cassette domain-containing protein [Ignisphaera sp.]
MVLLKIVDVSKSFESIVALDRVTLDVYEGEILGILGENGSGKSTLAKIIYGIYTPDSGYIEFNGIKVHFSSPRDAIENGIVMISQRPQLVEELSIADNVALFLKTSPSMAKKVVWSIMKRFEIDIEPDVPVNLLSYTEKQFIELVKALAIKPKLLIVDEATTYLPKEVREKFYRALKMLISLSSSVIFITHKINEAVEICDRIAILRRGKLINVYLNDGGLSVEVLRKAMFNEVRERVSSFPKTLSEVIEKTVPKIFDKNILHIENLAVLDDYGRRAVEGVNLSIRNGEILSIVGVAGNGQKELCEGIIGLKKVVEGRVLLDGIDITDAPTSRRVAMGLGYLPEDPFRDGVVLDLTVAENLKLVAGRGISKTDISGILNSMRIYPPNPKVKVYKFSGGNVQKISISRLKLLPLKCIIAYNPTRMLDEASSNFVKLVFKDMADKGVGILLVTEDVDEALGLANRIAVISRGKIVKIFDTISPSIREEIEEAMVLYG